MFRSLKLSLWRFEVPMKYILKYTLYPSTMVSHHCWDYCVGVAASPVNVLGAVAAELEDADPWQK